MLSGMSQQVPNSASNEVGGMRYFGRMLDKMRKFERGELREDFHENLGEGGDKRCCDFLRVRYEDLKTRALQGGSDEEILQWCYENGRRLNEGDLFVWNNFMKKIGWNDHATPYLEKAKADAGLADRDDIQTMSDFFDVDEGRRS